MEWYKKVRNHLIGMDKDVTKVLDFVESRVEVLNEDAMRHMQSALMFDIDVYDLASALFQFLNSVLE